MTDAKQRVPAYLTVYLALTLGVLVTLCLALTEGVRVSTMQLEAECIADACLDSVMAEYHQELFRRFNLLAIDDSYGTQTASKRNLEGRLAWYLDLNLGRAAGSSVWESLGRMRYKDFLGMELEGAEVSEWLLLTDAGGAVFREKAVLALQDDLGVAALSEALKWLQTVKEYQLDVRDVEAEKQAVDAQIAAYQGKEVKQGKEKTTLKFDSPTLLVDKQRGMGLTGQLFGDDLATGRAIVASNLISHRMKKGQVSQGNMALQEDTGLEQAAKKALFVAYLQSYYGCHGSLKEGSALLYEQEYILEGKEWDTENFRRVLKKLLALREAANVTYLFSDEGKRGQADVVALVLSTVLGVPELEELLCTTILFGWAYAESIYDVRTLVRGGRIPLLKNEKTWHYGLSSILEGLWETPQSAKEKEGLRYQDYLTIFLLLANEEEISYRAMDMCEADIRLTTGNAAFRMDACLVWMKAQISLRSKYGYRVALWEEKEY